jgi:glutamate 5-kinase
MNMGIAVVKIGSSSITQASGELDDAALVKLADDLAGARADGHPIVLVMSGAIAAGMPALGLARRPSDMGTLQAIAAVGQPRLLERMSALLGKHDLVAGQVLLTPYDFFHRSQYLHARVTCSTCSTWRAADRHENDTVATGSATAKRSAGAGVAHARRRLLLITPTPRGCSPPTRSTIRRRR